jgi:hypothetical protein
MRQGRSTFLANRLRELAWGCGFSALLTPPAVQSLSLAEISVRSHLGQPFEAVVSIGRAPNETLDSACFSVGGPGGGLPGIGGVRVSFDRAHGQLVLRSPAPVREPLSEITIRARCAGAPALDRTFLVMLDPPEAQADSALARANDARRAPVDSAGSAERAAAPVPVADSREIAAPHDTRSMQAAPPVARANERAGLPSPRRAPRPPAVAIEAGSSYLVQPGDTLSSVAERVRGRPHGSLWKFAADIHARNPAAFVGGDPDRLRAGVTLVIPSLDAGRLHSEAAAQAAFVEPVALAPREPATTPVVNRFALSTALSGDSLEKIRSRERADAEGAETAAALDAKPQGVLAARPADAVALDSESHRDAAPTDGAAAQAGATDARASRAPHARTAAVADATTHEPTRERAPAGPAHHGSWLRWIVSALGAVLFGALLGGFAMRVVIWRRQAAELHRRQSMRRASGLERSIRLDHGIIVKEHPAGTPLTIDASTQEIAAIRPVAQPVAAPIRMTSPPDTARSPESDAGFLDFATASPGEITLQLEGPLTDLDLLLPEVPDSSMDLNDIPTVAAATTPRETLDDSRQYSVDTDLMELAYRDETIAEADPDATVRLEMHEQPAAVEVHGAEAYDRLEYDPLDDTVLDYERADVSTVIALRDREDAEEPAPPKRARASRKA